MPNDIFSALPEKNATRTAFFGDLHVHTTYSLDAFNVGTMATPYDAYRYASGDTIKHLAGRERHHTNNLESGNRPHDSGRLSFT